MPRALIAGCGYVGSAAAELFQREGWEVEGWTSGRESAQRRSNAGFAVRAVDLRDEKAVQNAAKSVDVVIQSTSTRGGSAHQYRELYLQGARHLLAVFSRTPLLFCSSTSVYAQIDGDWVDEASPAAPEQDTAQVLREAEQLVLQHHGVVVRLAGLYGPGRSFLLQSLLNGRARLSAPTDRYLNQVHRDDAASALVFLSRNLPLRNELRPWIFNVADDAPALRNECLQWLADVLDRDLPAGPEEQTRRRGNTNKRVSNARLRALGWAPHYRDFTAGMRESVLPANRS